MPDARQGAVAEWHDEDEGPALHVCCHANAGIVTGSASLRYDSFQRELPLVLEAFQHGNRQLFQAHPRLDRAPSRVHFHSHRRRYRQTERWGVPGNYQL